MYFVRIFPLLWKMFLSRRTWKCIQTFYCCGNVSSYVLMAKDFGGMEKKEILLGKHVDCRGQKDTEAWKFYFVTNGLFVFMRRQFWAKNQIIKLGKARVWGLLFTDGAALLPQLLRQVSAKRVIKTKPFLLFHALTRVASIPCKNSPISNNDINDWIHDYHVTSLLWK